MIRGREFSLILSLASKVLQALERPIQSRADTYRLHGIFIKLYKGVKFCKLKIMVEKKPIKNQGEMKPPRPEVPENPKIGLESDDAGKLKHKLGFAFIKAIRSAEKVAAEGLEPANPFENSEVIKMEEKIRRTIDPGNQNIDDLIREYQDQTIVEQEFDLEKLKAQAKAVREGRIEKVAVEDEVPTPAESPKEILDSARASLLQMENKPDADGVNLQDARERYEKARAEYVGNIVERFVDEQEAIALGRAEQESRGGMREFAAHWRDDFAESWGKWLGLKREAIYKKALRNTTVGLAIGAAGIGAGVLGLAVPVGIGALGYFAVRRLLGAAATTFGVFEASQQRSTRKILKISDEELQKFSISDSEDRLRQLTVLARLRGSWDDVWPTYAKVKEYYIEQLQETQALGASLEAYIEGRDDVEREKLKELFGEERVRDQKRLLAGLGISLGVSIALPLGSSFAMAKIENWFGGSSVGVIPDVVESPRTGPREFFPTVFQPGEAPLHEARKAIALYMAETDKPDFKNLTHAQRLWAEERLWDTTKEQLKAAGSVPDDRHWQVGNQLTFRRDAIEKVLQDLKGQNADKLTDQYKDAVGRVNWRRYFAAGRHGIWEGDSGVKVRIPVSNLEDVVESHSDGKGQLSDYLRGRITEVPDRPLNTDPSQTPDLLAWNDGGNTVIETTTTETSPEFYRALNEHMITKLTGLEKPYYDAIKDLSIEKVLQKRSQDLSRYGSFQDKIRAVLNHLESSKQIEAKKLSVDEFIQNYISKK